MTSSAPIKFGMGASARRIEDGAFDPRRRPLHG